MSEAKTDKKETEAKESKSKSSFDWRDPRLMFVGIGLLVALSLYNTIALHLVAKAGGQADPALAEGGQKPSGDSAGSNDTGTASVNHPAANDASRESSSREESAASPESVAPIAHETREAGDEGGVGAGITGDDRQDRATDTELARLMIRAEQEMDENQRVLAYIHYANEFRRLNETDWSTEARDRAELELNAPVSSSLMTLGDSLRDKDDFAGALASYYLHLCRAERLAGDEEPSAYFRIADLAYRAAMQAPLEEDGL